MAGKPKTVKINRNLKPIKINYTGAEDSPKTRKKMEKLNQFFKDARAYNKLPRSKKGKHYRIN